MLFRQMKELRELCPSLWCNDDQLTECIDRNGHDRLGKYDVFTIKEHDKQKDHLLAKWRRANGKDSNAIRRQVDRV